MDKSEVRIFGVRHHGPGSAQALLAALEMYRPTALLVEGPPEGSDLIALLKEEGVVPPIALLAWNTRQPRRAVFYPFAVFSPEYNALRYALANDVPTMFIDLPLTHRLGEVTEEESTSNPEEIDGQLLESKDSIFEDLARAAGASDWESWWENTIESRQDPNGVFEAVLELSIALREGAEVEEENERREAAMRLAIRSVMKEGSPRIAVVCGAWHAAALRPETYPAAAADQAKLKGLPKSPISTTWIPWTNPRLARASGYGAGVSSPGWYAHRWREKGPALEKWLTLAAGIFRAEGMDVSVAQVIDAARLAEALCAIREKPSPSLRESDEAIKSVFLMGADAPMVVVRKRLICGEEVGMPPASAPRAPLMRDLEDQQKRLRLKPAALETVLELDLRKPLDLERSQLLYRLRLLDVPWGQVEHAGGKGTFKECWRLKWEPEMSVRVIECGAYGATVREAASGLLLQQSEGATLDVLVPLLWKGFTAALPEVTDLLIHRLENAAALAADPLILIKAFPRLAELARYRDIRDTDVAMVMPVANEVLSRICIGLEFFISGISMEEARIVLTALRDVNAALMTLEDKDQAKQWQDTLSACLLNEASSPLLRGAFTRWGFNQQWLDLKEVHERISFELSAGADLVSAIAWLEGFLQDGGGLLVHHAALRQVIDGWVCQLDEEDFIVLLPVLRKAFKHVESGERRVLFRELFRGGIVKSPDLGLLGELQLDLDRAEKVAPIFSRLMGFGEVPS